MKPFKRNKSENIFPCTRLFEVRRPALSSRDAGLNPVLELISKT
jgi:hypothetical protein